MGRGQPRRRGSTARPPVRDCELVVTHLDAPTPRRRDAHACIGSNVTRLGAWLVRWAASSSPSGAAGPPGRPGLGIGAGLIGGLGLIIFYTGLAAGPMSVVAPVSGLVSTVLPVGVALADGERPGAGVYAGALLCLAAIVLASSAGDTTPADGTSAAPRPGLPGRPGRRLRRRLRRLLRPVLPAHPNAGQSGNCGQ